DEAERIRAARVLGVRQVIQLHLARFRIEHDVLENGAEAVGSVPDLRLGLFRQLDHLRIAAALEVEDSTITPSMLVVADQSPLRIARQRRLAGTGPAEKQPGIAVRADIG